MGKNIAHAGAVGDGQTCKVVNQIIVALNIQAVSEALVFAPNAGADPGKVRAALMGGFASSKILEVHAERVWVWYENLSQWSRLQNSDRFGAAQEYPS